MGSSALVIKGFYDPSTLEMIACREALALAHDLWIQYLVISCDAKGVVEEINTSSGGVHSTIVNEIQGRRLNIQQSKVDFKSR